jgi:hypothetical protein
MVIALAPVARAQQADDSGQTVVDWNANTLAAILAADPPLAPTTVILALGMVQAAVYDAVVSIAGGYGPYVGAVEADPGASQAAAIASAAHDVLANLFPEQEADLQAKLDATLAAVEDGQAKDDGIAAGQAAAAALLAAREGDGRGVENPIAHLEEPGGWRPTPPDNLDYPASWIAKVKPFLADDITVLRTAGPYALDSAEYAADFNEVKELGSDDPSTRSDEQNAIAAFWRNPMIQWQGAERALAVEQGLSAVEAARLFALTGLGAADAIIGCFDDKYHWMFWRPVTAIAEADSDGNDATEPDPDWTPLVVTPPYPDHPSGFNCYPGAQVGALRGFFGSDDVALTFDGIGETPPPPRSFSTLTDVMSEIIDARVLQGLHFRAADVQAAELGQKAGQMAVDRLTATE